MATSSSPFGADPAAPLPMPDATKATPGAAAIEETAIATLSQQIFERAAVGMLVLDVAAGGSRAINPAFRHRWASLSCGAGGSSDEQVLAWLGERGILAQAEVSVAEGKTYTKLQLELANGDGEDEHVRWSYELVPLPEQDAQASGSHSVLLCLVDATEVWRTQRRADQAAFAIRQRSYATTIAPPSTMPRTVAPWRQHVHGAFVLSRNGISSGWTARPSLR